MFEYSVYYAITCIVHTYSLRGIFCQWERYQLLTYFMSSGIRIRDRKRRPDSIQLKLIIMNTNMEKIGHEPYFKGGSQWPVRINTTSIV